MGVSMMRQAGLFGLSDHLKRLSAHGDPLEELGGIVDFEAFRPTLTTALAYGDGSKGGRPPYDPVAMFKVLILAAQNNLSDARMEYLIRDRLSWLRFLGFDLGAPTPDANTIRLFREKLTEAGALNALFADFDRQLKERGYLAMGGQIVDATLVAAPKQRNTQPEKAAIKDGKKAGEIWPDKPAKARQSRRPCPKGITTPTRAGP
jgi:transposase